ncbi:MAG: ABC transporter permease, partial [Chloroflexi bacterium]|nr:ABC transporter permease [Chloroflexota bacterium]
LRSLLIGGLSIPNFWLGMLIILGLTLAFRWLPPLEYATVLTDPATSLQQFIFPALVLGYRQTAVGARMTRSAMLEVLRADYVRTARAKGLREQAVVWRHAFRNAILPVVTIFGLEMAVLFSGAVVIEKVFTLPGLGSLLVDAIGHRDVPVAQALVGLVVLFVVVVNLAVDLAYGFFDPRIRYR